MSSPTSSIDPDQQLKVEKEESEDEIEPETNGNQNRSKSNDLWPNEVPVGSEADYEDPFADLGVMLTDNKARDDIDEESSIDQPPDVTKVEDSNIHDSSTNEPSTSIHKLDNIGIGQHENTQNNESENTAMVSVSPEVQEKLSSIHSDDNVLDPDSLESLNKATNEDDEGFGFDPNKSVLISSINPDYDNMFTDSMIDTENKQNDQITDGMVDADASNHNNEESVHSAANLPAIDNQELGDNDLLDSMQALAQDLSSDLDTENKVAHAAIYTASAKMSEPQDQVINAVPLLAATEAITQSYHQDNFQTIDINEDNPNNIYQEDNAAKPFEIKSFDYIEKSFRDMGYDDDHKHLLSKQDDSDSLTNFHDGESQKLVNNDQVIEKSPEPAGFWFNIVAFMILVIVSGIIIAVVLIFVPVHRTEDVKPPQPLSPKHVIEGSCIKGQSIAMSSDGNKLLYVNSLPDSINIFNTSILLYDFNKNETKIIKTMTNIASALLKDMPVTISSDGNSLAYTSYAINNFTTINAFEMDSTNTWVPKGNSIQLFSLEMSLSMSQDGSYIAIGNPKDITNGIDSGKASLYNYVDNRWKPIESDSIAHNNIVGETGSLTGTSIAVSYNDKSLTFATGAPNYDNTGSFISNQYSVNANETKCINQTMQIGTSENILFGTSISLSDNGHRIAVGSTNYNFENTINNGKCDVFQYNHDTQTWLALGNSIIGQNYDYFLGYKVALSGDGNRVAISSKNPYMVQVYEYTSDNWGMLGTNFTYPNNDDISANDDTYQFGSSISLNHDGSVLAISTNSGGSSRYNSTSLKCGKVFLYDFSTSS